MNNCTRCGKKVITPNDDSPIRHVHDGSPADTITARGICEENTSFAKALEEPSAIKNLEEALETYKERNKIYGDNYKQFGYIMTALFPSGIPGDSPLAWNRLGVIVQIVSKLSRYAQNIGEPHKDSIHDIIVYAAMLEELDDLYREEGNG